VRFCVYFFRSAITAIAPAMIAITMPTAAIASAVVLLPLEDPLWDIVVTMVVPA